MLRNQADFYDSEKHPTTVGCNIQNFPYCLLKRKLPLSWSLDFLKIMCLPMVFCRVDFPLEISGVVFPGVSGSFKSKWPSFWKHYLFFFFHSSSAKVQFSKNVIELMSLNRYILFCLHLRKIILQLMSLIISNLLAAEPRTSNSRAEASAIWFDRGVDCTRWMQQKVVFSVIDLPIRKMQNTLNWWVDIFERIHHWL